MITIAAIAVALLLTPVDVRADAKISEWIGEYTMNHDGHQGSLHITESGADCASPPWCGLTVSYTDGRGTRTRAVIRLMDQDLQHMVFTINFPGNPQRFDGYLMSWDKNYIAGTTVWQGRTFGFYAAKRAQPTRGRLAGARGNSVVQPPIIVGPETSRPSGSAGASTKSINAQGEVESTLPDGRRTLRRPGQCNFTTIFPDGRQANSQCAEVQPATPPLPDPVNAAWLDAHNARLLEIIRALLGSDQNSLNNYLRANESPAQTLFDKIRIRTSVISLLTLS